MELPVLSNSKFDGALEPKTEIDDTDYNKILKEEMDTEVYTLSNIDAKREKYSPVKFKKEEDFYIEYKGVDSLPAIYVDASHASANSVLLIQANAKPLPHASNDINQVDVCDNPSKRNQMRKAAREKPHKCNICPASFSHKCSLMKHKKSHNREKLDKCFLCPATFPCTCMQHLVEHQQKPFKCSICHAGFSKKSQLNKHCQRVHSVSVNQIFQCDICPAEFSIKSHLLEHKGAHTVEKPYTCFICLATFTFISQFFQHQKEHFRENPNNCNICQEKFSNNSQLTEHHQKVHTVQTLFRCNDCPTFFITKANLIEHQKVHTAEKLYKYKCNMCPQGFPKKTHLIEHHLKVHTFEEPYKCDVCSATFISMSQLKTHQRQLKKKPKSVTVARKILS